jgi:hypothetical protein
MEALVRERDCKQTAQDKVHETMKEEIHRLTERLANVDSELARTKQHAKMLDLKLLDAVAEREVC